MVTEITTGMEHYEDSGLIKYLVVDRLAFDLFVFFVVIFELSIC